MISLASSVFFSSLFLSFSHVSVFLTIYPPAAHCVGAKVFRREIFWRMKLKEASLTPFVFRTMCSTCRYPILSSMTALYILQPCDFSQNVHPTVRNTLWHLKFLIMHYRVFLCEDDSIQPFQMQNLPLVNADACVQW